MRRGWRSAVATPRTGETRLPAARILHDGDRAYRAPAGVGNSIRELLNVLGQEQVVSHAFQIQGVAQVTHRFVTDHDDDDLF